ncbi:protein translocase subunit SecA [Striga asiatica]|uniref:Protein translocase subunit SecA n=1 Tax=Striga asiatica TaxID=4170 RepID=A0A5A7PLK1_STRAF|nr:protein translocase subunit SecA [Striga asiatica]
MVPKEDLQQIQKIPKAPGKSLPSDGLDEVTKVVATVKCYVGDFVIAHKAGRHHELGKPGGGHPKLSGLLKIDALVAEEVNRVWRVVVTRDVKVAEIELPYEAAVRAAEVREVPGRVGESDPHLDQLERVHVGLEGLVVLARVGVVLVGAEDDAGKLRVHGDEGEPVDEVADEGEFVTDRIKTGTLERTGSARSGGDGGGEAAEYGGGLSGGMAVAMERAFRSKAMDGDLLDLGEKLGESSTVPAFNPKSHYTTPNLNTKYYNINKNKSQRFVTHKKIPSTNFPNTVLQENIGGITKHNIKELKMGEKSYPERPFRRLDELTVVRGSHFFLELCQYILHCVLSLPVGKKPELFRFHLIVKTCNSFTPVNMQENVKSY